MYIVLKIKCKSITGLKNLVNDFLNQVDRSAKKQKISLSDTFVREDADTLCQETEDGTIEVFIY